MIVVRNLSKSFGDRVLFQGLSFSMDHGLLLVEGPSGCGKSTLLAILGGFQEKTSGEILFPDGKGKVAYCGMEPTLFSEETLRSNLRLLLGLKTIDERTAALAKRIGCLSLLDKKVFQMSGGERKKAELLLAFLKEADVYLLDECLAPLDKESRNGVLDLLRALSKEKVVLLVEHEKGAVPLPYDRRIVFGANGLTLSEGTVDRGRETFPDVPSLGKRPSPFFLVSRNAFKAHGLMFSLLTALLFFAFLFLLLSFTFFQPRASEKRQNAILRTDVFSVVQALPDTSESLYGSVPSDFLLAMEVDTSDGPTVFVTALDGGDTRLLHFSQGQNALHEGETFHGHDRTYAVSLGTERERDLVPDALDFRLLVDGYVPGSLTLCSPGFLDDLIDGEVLDGEGNVFGPLSGLSYQGGRFFFGEGEKPQIVEESHILSIPGMGPGEEIPLGTEQVLETTTSLSDDRIVVSRDVCFDLLADPDSGVLSFYVDKGYFEKAGNGLFVPKLFVQDYSEEVFVYAIVFLLLSFFLFIAFVLSLVFLRKNLRSWHKDVVSILGHAGFERRKEGFALFSFFLAFLPFVLSFLLYAIFFPCLANTLSLYLRYLYVPIPDGFYYYTMEPLCPYYDGIREPIDLFVFSPYALLFALLPLLLVSFVFLLGRKGTVAKK